MPDESFRSVYPSIREVVTITGDAELVNAYLKAGWIILNVCTHFDPPCNTERSEVLLGWTQAAPAPHPNPDWDDLFPSQTSQPGTDT